MVKSPLRYPGGKSRAVNFLSNYVTPFTEFRKPLFGGGSLSFYYVQRKTQTNFYASDINYDLYCFWYQLKTNGEQLIKEILKIKNDVTDGKKLFYSLLEKRKGKMTDFQRAVDFFVLNRITFSGVVDSGGYSESAFIGRFTYSSIDRLKDAIQVLKKIEITHGDYTELLFKPGKDVFIFLDPPYCKNTSSRLYGKKGQLHLYFDHNKFFKDLKMCTHKWIITYDNNNHLKELYKDYYIVEWELQYGMNNYKKNTAKKGKEILISNFDIVNDYNRKTETQLTFDML